MPTPIAADDPRLNEARRVFDLTAHAVLQWRQARAERHAAHKAQPFDATRARAANKAERQAFDQRGSYESMFRRTQRRVERVLGPQDRVDWAVITRVWAQPYLTRPEQQD